MPTPDERRATWVEPGISRRVEDGDVKGVSIDLRRVDVYGGNGMTLLEGEGGRLALILTPAAIRRLWTALDDAIVAVDGLSLARNRDAVGFARRHGWS